jgi:hypothetical protein
MESVMATHRGWKEQWPRGVMRVAVLEPSAENRAVLRCALDELPGFQMVGESATWEDCRSLLDLYLPELVIARTNDLSWIWPNGADNAVFPVVIAVRVRDFRGTPGGAFETIEIPFDPRAVSVSIQNARTEIYRRKLDEVSALLGRYMAFSPNLSGYVTSIPAEDGGATEIPADCVMFMAAYGNYVRVHTDAAIHEIRDTMTAMTSKLNPAQFARVHRSFIVNRSRVASVLRKEGTAICVLLNNGTEIPVGPNYRSEVESFDWLDRRLSA